MNSRVPDFAISHPKLYILCIVNRNYSLQIYKLYVFLSDFRHQGSQQSINNNQGVTNELNISG